MLIVTIGEMEMNKVNNQNLEALKAYYSVKPKKAEKDEKKEEVQTQKQFETREVEASALDAAAAQIWGAQLSKVDKSDVATQKRLEQAMANSTFMASLDKLQGTDKEFDFAAYAMANITGVNLKKLSTYLQQPLSAQTQKGVITYLDSRNL